MICALHQNPVKAGFGVAVRTVNILRIVGQIFGSSVTLYTLAGDNDIKNLDETIIERHIEKPWIFKRISGGYLCMYPYLVKRKLKQSEVYALKPKLTIFEGPFMAYATLKAINFPANSVTVYDAHNVEANYWQQYVGNGIFGQKILNRIRKIEKHVLEHSDHIFATSDYEKNTFEREYGIDPKKIVVVPNGVNTSVITPMNLEEKLVCRKKHDWNYAHYVVFMGSKIKPNIIALEYTISKLAKALPNVGFIVIGSVCETNPSIPDNVRLQGILDEFTKNLFLAMADIAINPIITGAGTNVKMLEYLSAGLPVVTTPIGARGLTVVDGRDVIIDNIDKFHERISEIIDNDSLRQNLANNARMKAMEYDWDNIKQTIQNRFQDIPKH